MFRSTPLALAGAVCAALSVSSCTRVAEPPAVAFTTVPRAGEGGSAVLVPVAGTVRGARPGQRIVLFAKSNLWWVQPLADEPYTAVRPDGTWSAQTHVGTEYAALLVDASYRPVTTLEALPSAGGPVVAVATAKGSGSVAEASRRTLHFSGYEWEVRQKPSDRAGSNDYDARNARVDERGHLHLRLVERDGRWTSAELKLTRALGYGTYSFVVDDTSALDPAALVGLFTWDELGQDQNHREIDIELSRWGGSGEKDAQYVIQPYYVAANVYRFKAPASRATHSFRWEPGRVVFRTIAGEGAEGLRAPVTERTFTAGVPVPGDEAVHVNLLYFRGAPAPPRGPVEVVLEKFEYLP